MSSSPPVQDMVSVARARLNLPDGTVDGDIDAFYPEALPDCYLVPLFDGDEGGPVVIYAPSGRVAAHSGLDVAAARLRDLRLLEVDPATVEVALRPLLEAVGGMGPGRPPWPDEQAETDGGARLVLTADEPWVRFAAGGALGPPPMEEDRSDARGITPPAPQATMTATVDSGYRLHWQYEGDDGPMATFDGDPDRAAGDTDDPSGAVPPVVAEWAICAARRRRKAPLSVAARPVVAIDGRWAVHLIGSPDDVVVERDDLIATGMPAAELEAST